MKSVTLPGDFDPRITRDHILSNGEHEAIQKNVDFETKTLSNSKHFFNRGIVQDYFIQRGDFFGNCPILKHNIT